MAKIWIRQLRADHDNHGLKTKCDQDNWLHNPITKLKFTDGGDFKANAIGKRSQTVQCANENCGRMFHSKKEMYRHLRDNHSEPSVQTFASEIETNKGTKRTVTIKGIERTVEIPQQPSDGGPKRVNSTALCRLLQDLCLCQRLDKAHAKLSPACETDQRIRTDRLSTATESAILRIKPRH